MSIKTVETGLPFFGSIQRQARYRSYFNFYSQEWICPKNRYPSFQFYTIGSASPVTFLLYNAENDSIVDDITVYFNANVTTSGLVGANTYYTHAGTVTVTLTPGRYYFKASDTSYEWYSEVFTVTNLEE